MIITLCLFYSNRHRHLLCQHVQYFSNRENHFYPKKTIWYRKQTYWLVLEQIKFLNITKSECMWSRISISRVLMYYPRFCLIHGYPCSIGTIYVKKRSLRPICARYNFVTNTTTHQSLKTHCCTQNKLVLFRIVRIRCVNVSWKNSFSIYRWSHTFNRI